MGKNRKATFRNVVTLHRLTPPSLAKSSLIYCHTNFLERSISLKAKIGSSRFTNRTRTLAPCRKGGRGWRGWAGSHSGAGTPASRASPQSRGLVADAWRG